MFFRDRHEAGKMLGMRFLEWEGLGAPPHLAVAVSNEAVPIACELGRAIHCPTTLLGVSRFAAPGNPQLEIGAVAEDSEPLVNRNAAEALGVTAGELDEVATFAAKEARRRGRELRPEDSFPRLEGVTAVVVEETLDSSLGVTTAAKSLRARGAHRVILAVPVASMRAVQLARTDFDAVICLQKVIHLPAPSFWYGQKESMTDNASRELLQQAAKPVAAPLAAEEELEVAEGRLRIEGHLALPRNAVGVIIFAQAGGVRRTARDASFARVLHDAGFATFHASLLSPSEAADRSNLFDIELLTTRLLATTARVRARLGAELPYGYLGIGTAAAAALQATTLPGSLVTSVVCVNGRPDLVRHRLPMVPASVLLITGSSQPHLAEQNRKAASILPLAHAATISAQEDLLFDFNALDIAAQRAARWFRQHHSSPPTQKVA